MQIRQSYLSVLVLLASGTPFAVVSAQCRTGSGPDHGDGIPYCSQSAPQSTAPSGPRWAMRWGAIAYGGGGFGASTDMASVAKAKKAALRACRDSGGGKNCKVALAYSDQCAAYAIGDDYSVGVARSPIPQEAHTLAITSCAESTSNCKVTYSACSLPVQIK
jgi:hypothetical protein